MRVLIKSITIGDILGGGSVNIGNSMNITNKISEVITNELSEEKKTRPATDLDIS